MIRLPIDPFPTPNHSGTREAVRRQLEDRIIRLLYDVEELRRFARKARMAAAIIADSNKLFGHSAGIARDAAKLRQDAERVLAVTEPGAARRTEG